jgi:hypothetical protein
MGKNIQSFNEHSKNENLDLSDVSSSDTITLTKEELKTFMDDVEQGIGSWSDTSYRICRFIGIDPTDGV